MSSSAEIALSACLRQALPMAAGDVRLRSLRTDDLPAFLAYRQDPEVARFQGFSPMDATEAHTFLQEMAPSTELLLAQWLQLGIARRADNVLVGDIGLLHEQPGQVQIGFTLAPTAQGRGWATAAVGALCERLLMSGVCHTMRAVSDSRNARSLRLLQRLGFVEIARTSVVVKGEHCIDVTLSSSPVSRPTSHRGFTTRPLHPPPGVPAWSGVSMSTLLNRQGAEVESPTPMASLRRVHRDDETDHSLRRRPNGNGPSPDDEGPLRGSARCCLGWLMGTKTAT
jgi:RimJ/RimL family protein N-acetyltransferase